MDSFLLLFTLLYLKADFSDGVLITQWPNYISSLPGSSVKMHCYQNDTDYDYKYWYRQIKGEGPVLIGSYNFNSPTNEKGFETGFTISIHGPFKLKKKGLEFGTLSEFVSADVCCDTGGSYPAYFGNGTKLTVLGKNIQKSANVTLPKVKILPPSPKEICSQDKINDKRSTLVCVASGFYPDHVSVSWKVNGVARQDSVSTDTSAQQDKTTLMYHISSRIKVNDTDWMDLKSSFACTVQFFNGDEYTVDISKYIE
uniref:Ig-like domain-containing protein n=1 Tax=Sinocyclocheilus rhinocerous TaxID=307959 RepID=A0A673NK65_9TELE